MSDTSNTILVRQGPFSVEQIESFKATPLQMENGWELLKGWIESAGWENGKAVMVGDVPATYSREPFGFLDEQGHLVFPKTGFFEITVDGVRILEALRQY
jgi:hypothetical protein